jgi:hypothetical protein
MRWRDFGLGSSFHFNNYATWTRFLPPPTCALAGHQCMADYVHSSYDNAVAKRFCQTVPFRDFLKKLELG